MYIGNDLQVAFSTYKNIDDISGSFNGVTTSFALLVNGVAPAPLPLNSNQCLISVGGVVQRPDDTGAEGFRLSGGNIVFSSAPNTAEDFFGVILAGADYVNAGANFPDGTLAAPSITFDQDNDTGYYRSGSGSVSFASNGVAAGTWSSAGLTAPAFIPTGSSVPANGVYLPSANTLGVSTNGSARLTVDSSGRLLVGTSTARSNFNLYGANYTAQNQFENASVIGLAVTRPGGAFLTLANSTTATSGDTAGVLTFNHSDGTNLPIAAQIAVLIDGTPGANDMPGRLVFSTTADGASSPTERMRITQAGLVDIGTQGTAPTGVALTVRSSGDIDSVGSLQVRNTNTAAAATVASFITATNSTAVSNVLIRFGIDNYNTGSGQINANGSNAAAFGTFSDSRLKENVEDLPSQWNNIKGLRPVEFDYIESEGGGHQIGFIAQNVQQIYPDVVGDRGDGMLTLSGMSKQDSRLIKALQEAMERIEQLEQRLTDAGIA